MFIRHASAAAMLCLFTACSSAPEAPESAPATATSNQTALRVCRSVANAEGRCVDASIPAVAAHKDVLPRADCESAELCAPCFDPTNASDTTVCRQNGDAPREPATTLAACCGGRGSCVDSKLVGDLSKNLASCEGARVCVPKEFVANRDHKGAACKGNVSLGSTKIPYDGVCLSDCLDIESKELLSRDGCGSSDLCVPCKHPATGEATGAPGCEP